MAQQYTLEQQQAIAIAEAEAKVRANKAAAAAAQTPSQKTADYVWTLKGKNSPGGFQLNPLNPNARQGGVVTVFKDGKLVQVDTNDPKDKLPLQTRLANAIQSSPDIREEKKPEMGFLDAMGKMITHDPNARILGKFGSTLRDMGVGAYRMATTPVTDEEKQRFGITDRPERPGFTTLPNEQIFTPQILLDRMVGAPARQEFDRGAGFFRRAKEDYNRGNYGSAALNAVQSGGYGLAGLTPVLGPMITSIGDTAVEEGLPEALGQTGAFIAAPEITKRALNAPGQAYRFARNTGGIRTQAADTLEARAAQDQARQIQPTTKQGKADVRDVAGEIAQTGGIPGIRQATIDSNIVKRHKLAKENLDVAEDNLRATAGLEHTYTERSFLLDEIDKAKRALNLADTEVTARPDAIAQLDELRGLIAKLPERIKPTTLLDLRKQLDGIAEDAGAYSVNADSLRSRIFRGGADMVRGRLNPLSDELRAANHEYSVTRKLADVVEQRDLMNTGKIRSGLPGNGGILDDVLAGWAGQAMGGTTGMVIAEAVNLARQTPGWAGLKSRFEQRLANTIRPNAPPPRPELTARAGGYPWENAPFEMGPGGAASSMSVTGDPDFRGKQIWNAGIREPFTGQQDLFPHGGPGGLLSDPNARMSSGEPGYYELQQGRRVWRSGQPPPPPVGQQDLLPYGGPGGLLQGPDVRIISAEPEFVAELKGRKAWREAAPELPKGQLGLQSLAPPQVFALGQTEARFIPEGTTLEYKSRMLDGRDSFHYVTPEGRRFSTDTEISPRLTRPPVQAPIDPARQMLMQPQQTGGQNWNALADALARQQRSRTSSSMNSPTLLDTLSAAREGISVEEYMRRKQQR